MEMNGTMTMHSPRPASGSLGENGRPKGILKNPSFQASPSKDESAPVVVSPIQASRPPLDTELSDKDLTLQNTLQNAGPRRSSSNPRPVGSRRQSSHHPGDDDENSPRLKWDEANLYLTEQEKSSTMKIDEPKTPYAKKYDPSEDEETEVRTLDMDDLVVDELDKVKGSTSRTKEDEIPGLELGEPEEAVPDHMEDDGRLVRSASQRSEKQVVVDPVTDDGLGGHGEGHLSREESEKHRKFEEMRKRHYEMRDVKGLLGHPEELDAMDEDEDGPATVPNGAPPMPSAPAAVTANTNGS